MAGFTTTATIGAGSSSLNVGAANTGKFNIGDDVNEIDNVIGAGVTVLSVSSSGVVILSQSSFNTASVTQTVSIGSTEFVSYNIRQYDKRDIYDEFSSNDEFELQADEIVDFAETNPFGTY